MRARSQGGSEGPLRAIGGGGGLGDQLGRIVHELIAAGVEGGSKRAIEDDWSLTDYRDQRAYWRRVALPVNLALVPIGQVLGVKWKFDDDDDAAAQLEPDAGPSIRDLAAAIAPPIPGGDTLEASRAIIEAMARQGSPTLQ